MKKYLLIFSNSGQRITKNIEAINLDQACEKANKIAYEEHLVAEDVMEV
jgi:hypothetical protein